MSIRGIFASHSGIVGDRVGDLASRVLVNGFGGTAPLLALSSGMKSEKVSDTSYAWLEDSHIAGNTTSTSNANASTTVPVADTNIWTPNTIVLNQNTGEHMLITAINGLSLTVIRGMSGTTITNIATGHVLQSVGTAFEEGGGKPTPVAQRGESRINHVQIFKNGWAITGTATAIDFTTGSQLAENKTQALAYHAEDIERAFLFGKPGVMVVNNKQLRTSGGILHLVETYGGRVESALTGGNAGTLSMADLLEFLRKIFDRQVKGMPNERISFTSSKVVSLIQRMVRKDSTYNIKEGESAFGIKVMKIEQFNGDLTLMTHPMMNENTAWGKELYVLHPALIKKRILRETWTQEFGWNSNNNNGVDATEGFIADEMGFQLGGAETMGILKNITTAVASA